MPHALRVLPSEFFLYRLGSKSENDAPEGEKTFDYVQQSYTFAMTNNMKDRRTKSVCH